MEKIVQQFKPLIQSLPDSTSLTEGNIVLIWIYNIYLYTVNLKVAF